MFCLAEIEKRENNNAKIENESFVVTVLLIAFFSCFSGVILLLTNGNCADYFSREYSIDGFVHQFGSYALIAAGAISFCLAGIRAFKLICEDDNKEYKRIIVSISFVLFAYAAALIQFAQGRCVNYYSEEFTLFSLTLDYSPFFLLFFGTLYLCHAIYSILKIIAKKNNV